MATLSDPEALEPVDPGEETDEVEAPPPVDPERLARRSAALARIRAYGDPVLTTRTRTVERFDASLLDEAHHMASIMHEAMGIGLAAPQVGVLHRLLVYRVEPDTPVTVLVNPRLEWHGSEEEILEEGCLSLPGVHVDIERSVHVRVHAQDEHGEELMIEATGLEARVIQHEMDHLDGVLILERASRDQRKEAMRAMREAQRDA